MSIPENRWLFKYFLKAFKTMKLIFACNKEKCSSIRQIFILKGNSFLHTLLPCGEQRLGPATLTFWHHTSEYVTPEDMLPYMAKRDFSHVAEVPNQLTLR